MTIEGYDKAKTDALLSAKADIPTAYKALGASSGTLSVTATDALTQAFSATAALSVSMQGGSDGDFTTLVCTSGGGDVTWAADAWPNGKPDDSDDVQVVNMLRVDGGWWGFPATATAPPDTTAPTAGTLSVAVTSDTAILSVSGALDTGSGLDPKPYSYSKDDGATWTDWQTAATYEYDGLTPATSYTFQHRVRDAAGNVKDGAAVTKSTPATQTWTTYVTDDFTATDGTALDGRATTTGGQTWATNVADLTHGETATIESDKAALAATSFAQLTATVPYPAGYGTGVRVTFDYDVSAANSRASAHVETNNASQPAYAWMASGTAVSFDAQTNDTWDDPTTADVPPDTGTAVAEYHRNTDGTLSYTLTVDGTTVLSVSGTAAAYRGQPTTSQSLGIASQLVVAGPATSTFDNFKIEYI